MVNNPFVGVAFGAIRLTVLFQVHIGSLDMGASAKIAQLADSHACLRTDLQIVGTSRARVRATPGDAEVAALLRLSQAVTREIDIEQLIERLLVVSVQYAGADRALLLLRTDARVAVEAEATTIGGSLSVRRCHSAPDSSMLPTSIVNFCIRSGEIVTLDDTAKPSAFGTDSYLTSAASRSVLCLPLSTQGRRIGVLYLENSLAPHAFSASTRTILGLLSVQAAIALENARLYSELVVQRDELHRSEAAQRLGEAFLAVGQRISRTGSWRWILSSGDTMGSVECYRILGLDLTTSEPLSYERYLRCVHPADLARVERRLACATRDKVPFSNEYRIVRPDGSIRCVRAIGEPRTGDSGELEYVGVIMDVTEQRAAEDALAQARAALTQASRLSIMGELAASITHEITQPLGAIVTSAEAGLRWLERPDPDLAETKEALRRLLAAGTRAAQVIRGLRGLAERTTPTVTKLELDGVVTEVCDLMRNDLQGSSTELVLDLNLKGCLSLADRIQLQQVLLNLIRNAIESMSDPTVHVRRLRIATSLESPSAARVTVEDSGIGIDPVNTTKLFEPLFSTKRDGMGMGLAICRSIITAHGGRLWAEAGAAGGAAFCFALPVTEQTKV